MVHLRVLRLKKNLGNSIITLLFHGAEFPIKGNIIGIWSSSMATYS